MMSLSRNNTPQPQQPRSSRHGIPLFRAIVFLGCMFLILSIMVTTTTATGDNDNTTSEVSSSFGNVMRSARLLLSFAFGFGKNPQPAHQGLQVLGGGFMRTGTKSTEAALGQLGHRVYDTEGMMKHGHVKEWMEAARAYSQHGDLGPMDAMATKVEELGYTATLDFPMNLFALPLAKVRPNAKVLTTIRDNPLKWYASFLAISWVTAPIHCLPWSVLIGDLSYATDLVEILYGIPVSHEPEKTQPLPWYEYVTAIPSVDSKEAKARWLGIYDTVYNRQKEEIEPERLLVFNVKQGWKPVLDFLEIDDEALAKEEFPKHNDRKSMETVGTVMNFVGATFPIWIILMMFVPYKIIAWMCFRKAGSSGGDTKVKTS